MVLFVFPCSARTTGSHKNPTRVLPDVGNRFFHFDLMFIPRPPT